LKLRKEKQQAKAKTANGFLQRGALSAESLKMKNGAKVKKATEVTKRKDMDHLAFNKPSSNLPPPLPARTSTRKRMRTPKAQGIYKRQQQAAKRRRSKYLLADSLSKSK
jgi:hypothetical protein